MSMAIRFYKLEVERRFLLSDDSDLLEQIKSKSKVTVTADRVIIESKDLFDHLKIQNDLEDASIPFDESAW